MANIRKYILHIPNDQLNTILTKVQKGESGADDLFCSTLYPDVEKYCEGKVKDGRVWKPCETYQHPLRSLHWSAEDGSVCQRTFPEHGINLQSIIKSRAVTEKVTACFCKDVL